MTRLTPGDKVRITDPFSFLNGGIGTVSGHVPSCVTSCDTIVTVEGRPYFFSEVYLDKLQTTADAHPCDDGCLTCNDELDRHLITEVA